MQDPAPRNRLGQYHLVRELGAGGMGKVYLARSTEPSKTAPVVIKTLRAELAGREDVLSMFDHEAKLGSRLRHPNIARVQEVGHDGDSPYLVMEWVPGPSLAEITTRYPRLPYAAILRIVSDVAAALQCAHTATDDQGESLNIVHRDVTPQNILVSVDGQVKLIDFGVARSDGRSYETETGVLKGKLSYLAPEQFRGKVDHRADLFSLGVVLYELLEGRRLFRRATQAEVASAILFDTIPRLGGPTLARQVLQPIADRALARNLEERYAGAESFRADLLSAMEELDLSCTDTELASIVHQVAGGIFRDAKTAATGTASMPEWTAMPPARVLTAAPDPAPLDDATDVDLSTAGDRTVADAWIPTRDVVAWTHAELAMLESATTTEAETHTVTVPDARTPHGETAELPTMPRALEMETAVLPTRLEPVRDPDPARRPTMLLLGMAAFLAAGVGLAVAMSWDRGGNDPAPTTPSAPQPGHGEPGTVPEQAPGTSIERAEVSHSPGPQTQAVEGSARAQPPAEIAAPRGRGRLWLGTEPWSEVVIGGRALGTTPLVGIPLPAGAHRVRMTDPDGRVHTRRIVIRAGQPTKRFITLRP